MKENSVPEEKLLKIIRKDAKRQGGGVSGAVPEKAAGRGRLKQKYDSLLNIRSVVMAFFVFSCVYFLWVVAYPFVGLQKLTLTHASFDKGVSPRAAGKIEIKPFQYYKDGIANKQVFKTASPAGAETPVNIAGAESIKDFSLMGIISGDNPQAVIQESKSQKTYYLNKGQSVGEYTVEDILPDKVILNSDGKRYELFL